jgi:hypothetical protein
MKKYLCILMIGLFLPLWGCSDSSNSEDPIKNFRLFAEKSRELVYDEFLLAGREYAALPDDDPAETDYLVANEDLYLQYFYFGFIFNNVISFDIERWEGNTYFNENGDSTITVQGGIYTLESEYYMELENSMERLNVTFVWNANTSRWLITGERVPVPSGGNPPAPWVRQEGAWIGNNTAYSATTFFIDEEDAQRHVGNTIFTYGVGGNTLRMALEREGCVEDCVDIETTDLFDLGVAAAAGSTGWDDFKQYQVEDGIPDYEIPPVIEDAR